MSTWTLEYTGFEPEQEGLREALTSTGNGVFATRGVAEWATADDVHYPGTYVHGGFNRETTIMAGRPIVNEDLVNLPNWLGLSLRIEGDEPFALSNVQLLDYRHTYDIRTAVLTRSLRFRDRRGRETRLTSRRFVSMAARQLAAIEWTLTAENWSGQVEVISALDGRVRNWGVPRYRQLESQHLAPVLTRIAGPDVIALLVQTRQSRIAIAEAARTRVYGAHAVVHVERHAYRMDNYVHQVLSFPVDTGEPVRIEKLVALHTSRDSAISEPLVNAEEAAARAPSFAQALEAHEQAWDELWSVCDITLPGDPEVQQLLRLHTAHILQVCSPFTADRDAGVPARGLNGEAYRGHIFWDELYIYPFLNFRLPSVTRGLLMYRYRRLDAARAAAREAGYRGAMFPWQSGSDGREETQVVHLNPRSGRWDPDHSHNQRHVNAAIFANIWRYWETTHDQEFLWFYGAEMMLEIARFWASIAHYNPERDRYEIHGVMGPDEYHEQEPGVEAPGLRNNAYTNVMVAWICATAKDVLAMIPERRRAALIARIGLSDDEIALWDELAHKLFVPFHAGVISQFEGYAELEEFDWDGYRERYGNIQRLDRILKAEGKSPDHYKLSKQADVLMLYYLFAESELEPLFERLGYTHTPELARRNIDYYTERTSHGSTLSFVVHAFNNASRDPEASWAMFMTALRSDLDDIQGGTTREGIHMGVMAGTLDLIQRGFLGASCHADALCFQPQHRERLNGLRMPMRFRGVLLDVRIEADTLSITALPDGASETISICVGGERKTLPEQGTISFSLG
jgi:trehalose/maltose hydrolase-like predicted phosphorylase